MPPRPKLRETVSALEKLYGKPVPFPSNDPWELILRENASYLVDDATRDEVFRLLKARVGVSPEAILGAPRERLLAAGSAVTLAPDSNGLRVLVRLGYAKEDANYAKTYRAAAEAVTPELPNDTAWLVAAHQVLRRHGQETCRRSEPRCDVCPLARGCDFPSAATVARAR